MRGFARGFSLAEMVVVLGLVAILAVLAVPAYQQYMYKARRTDAITTLMSIYAAQERWRASDTDYATLAELGWSGMTSLDGHYALKLVNRTGDSFRILAVPQPGGMQAGDPCARFAITRDGPDHSPPFADRMCWQR